MQRRKWQREWMGWLKGALIMPCLALLGAATLYAQGPREGESRTVRGTVESLTTAPRGEVDGAVLDDGTVLHWPPHLEDRFAELAKKGERVTAVGFSHVGKAGDERLEIRQLTNVDTKATAENDGPGPRGKRRKAPPPPPRRSERMEKVSGTVDRMTTAPKGEVDGAVLDDGTVLHWPPHLQDRFAALVKPGDRVEATGFEERTPRGDEHFEIASLTNLRTEATADNDDIQGRTAPRPPRDADRGNRDKDRADRIRDLTRQVERLQREIERLERDL